MSTRDRADKLGALLNSVMRSDDPSFELVIVDQSVDDSTERVVTPFLDDSRVRLVRSSNVGLSKGRNEGIALTSAEYIVITDDDCLVPPGWLRGITRPFEDDPRVGVVFCSVEPVPVSSPGHTPHIIFSVNRTIASLAEAWTSARRGLPLGAGMAVRRAMFEDVGGFDESLGPGARFGATEDSDLSWRGLRRGWKTCQTADVIVIHDGFRDLDELRDLVRRDLFGVGGAIAKYVRAREFRAIGFLWSWIWRLGVAAPVGDLLARRRPRGLRRPYLLLRGLAAGLRTPLDRERLLFAPHLSNVDP